MTEALDATKILVVYGPLGLMTLLAIALAVVLWRTWDGDRKAAKELMSVHAEQLARLNTARAEQLENLQREHKDEMKMFADRYMAKAESWATKWQENAEAQMDLNTRLQDLVEKLQDMAQRRRGGG